MENKMENKQKEQGRKELDLNELEKVSGGIVQPARPDDDDDDDHEGSGGGATGGW